MNLCIWWKVPNLFMSSEQMRWAGLIGPERQLRLWI